MNLQREAVHEAASSTRRVVESADELVQLLLRRDDEPHRPAADAAEALHHRLEVEHLPDVARHELSDLVDHEDERVPGLPTGHQLLAALGEKAWRDVRTTVSGVAASCRPSANRHPDRA